MTSSYLEQYDAADPAKQVQLAATWIRTDWKPFFQELRESRPILETARFTMLSKFADCVEVLGREKVFTVAAYTQKMDDVVGPFMLGRDATPLNWREKGIMQSLLMPEDLPRIREMAGKLADEALDAAAAEGKIEGVGMLGRFVPIRIVGDYFGFPGPDLDSMYRWSKATQTDFFKNQANDEEIHAAAVQAGQEMRQYLGGLLSEKRQALASYEGDPPQDTFSRLLRSHFPDELGFDDERILSNVMGLLVGSGETTSQAIVQVIEQILERPEVHEQAVAAAQADDPAEFDRIVWEALRFNPINPLLFRVCVQEYTVAAGTDRATTIKPGTVVFALTSSAGFDADVIEAAEEFRPGRPIWTDFTFGFGHHTCLGKYVGSVMVPEVVRRVLLRPEVRLLAGDDGKIDFKGGPFPETFWFGFGSDG